MSEKILVTCAEGNVGSRVLDLLKQQSSVEIRAASYKGTVDEVDSIAMDYSDINSLNEATHGISTIYMVIPTDPDMVQWGRNLIAAAKKNGVKHIVRLSTSLAKVDSPLKAIQLLSSTDQDVINSGIDYTIIAPQFFMQNFINFYSSDYKNGTLYLPAGDGKIGWVDVTDIASVSVAALMSPKNYRALTLTVTGSENLSYEKAVEQMNEVLGLQSKYVAVADEIAIEAMQEKQFPSFVIDFMLSLNHSVVNGYTEEVTDTVEKVTGKKPITFKQFITKNMKNWL
jgi:uncharacterized protein YbjT (DUF2867 family)